MTAPTDQMGLFTEIEAPVKRYVDWRATPQGCLVFVEIVRQVEALSRTESVIKLESVIARVQRTYPSAKLRFAYRPYIARELLARSPALKGLIRIVERRGG